MKLSHGCKATVPIHHDAISGHDDLIGLQPNAFKLFVDGLDRLATSRLRLIKQDLVLLSLD